jgi:hypothetical protein
MFVAFRGRQIKNAKPEIVFILSRAELRFAQAQLDFAGGSL